MSVLKELPSHEFNTMADIPVFAIADAERYIEDDQYVYLRAQFRLRDASAGYSNPIHQWR